MTSYAGRSIVTLSGFYLTVGTVIAEKYEIERVIGQGGMGAVYAARHLLLDETVAIKLLLPHQQDAPVARERLLREARSTLRIRSEHVSRTLDVGVLDDGTTYMVLEYLVGKDLEAHVVDEGPLSVADAVDAILQASHALAEAHALGIVHRDIKPSNLFRTQRPTGDWLIKVIDFGISKARVDAGAKLTATNTSIGTPCYMSPEQIRNSSLVDSRTDIWALGITLFELLTLQLPFEGDGALALCAAATSDPATPLCRVRLDAPAELEAIILRCLEKKADDRFQSVADLAVALEPFGPPSAAALVESIGRMVARKPDEAKATAVGLSSAKRVAVADATTVAASPRDGGSGPKVAGSRLALLLVGGVLTVGVTAAVVVSRANDAPRASVSGGAPVTSVAPTASQPVVVPSEPTPDISATPDTASPPASQSAAPAKMSPNPRQKPAPSPSAAPAAPPTADPKGALRDRE